MFQLDFSYVFILFCVLIYFINRWFRRILISDFKEKHVFITGTDSGFGERMAMYLDNMGVYVYAGCYTESGATKLKNISSKRLKTVILDITKQDSVDQALKFIEYDLPDGKFLWGLVNNAGILGNTSFELANVEDYRKAMEVNFYGHIRICEAFSPLIKKAKGRIVNVISMYGRISVGMEPYTCAKFAMEPYTDGLRRSLRKYGVKVTMIEPGCFPDTNINQINAQTMADLNNNWEMLPDWRKAELGNDFVQSVKDEFDALIATWPVHGLNNKDMVAKTGVHALSAKYPKTRYTCGYDARPMIFLVTFTPDWLLDTVLRIMNWRLRRIIRANKKLI